MAFSRGIVLLLIFFNAFLKNSKAQSNNVLTLSLNKGQEWTYCEKISAEVEVRLEQKRIGHYRSGKLTSLTHHYDELKPSQLNLTLGDNNDICLKFLNPTEWWIGKQIVITFSNEIGLTVSTTNFKTELFEAPVLLNVDDIIAKEGDAVDIVCSATGSPGLVVKVVTPLADKGENGPISSEQTATIRLQNVQRSMEGEFECQASISKDGNVFNSTSVKRKLIVQYPPKIRVNESQILTDTKVTEIITATGEGNPKPDIDCTFYNIQENRSVVFQDIAKNTVQMQMKVMAFQLKDAGVYTCTATNSLGSDSANVSLILGPLDVKISRPSMEVTAPYCNYYLLNLTVQSRALINETTIRVTRSDNQKTSEYVVLTDSDYPGQLLNGRSWLRAIQGHISNLTEGKSYNVSLTKVCNSHNCWERSPGDPQTIITLKTPTCKAKGEVAPAALQQRLNAADGKLQPTAKDDNGSNSVHVMNSLSVISLVLAYCLHWLLRNQRVAYL